jgi:hypothetical protein
MPTRASTSFDTVSLLPKKRRRPRETEYSPEKVQLNDRPHPEATKGRRLFHDGHVTGRIGDVDQVGTGKYARGEKYGLSEGRLVSRGKAGNQAGVCGVRMEEVDEQGEDWAQRANVLAL